MLSNNIFLGKCWYGGHPWIRLAMESESMVEKGINFIFCLGTAYDVSSMENTGHPSPRHERYEQTKEKFILKVRDGTCKFA